MLCAREKYGELHANRKKKQKINMDNWRNGFRNTHQFEIASKVLIMRYIHIQFDETAAPRKPWHSPD